MENLHALSGEWWIAVVLLLAALLLVWRLFRRPAKPQRTHTKDVLDEGAERAQRNQALIDAPSASSAGAVATADTAPASVADEPAKAAGTAAPDPVPASEAPVAAPTGDDLRRLKGVGPKLVALLHGLGITRYDQIAAWDDAEIDRIDALLGTFAGRIRRDSWVEQARLLSSGDKAAYEAKFGKLPE